MSSPFTNIPIEWALRSVPLRHQQKFTMMEMGIPYVSTNSRLSQAIWAKGHEHLILCGFIQSSNKGGIYQRVIHFVTYILVIEQKIHS